MFATRRILALGVVTALGLSGCGALEEPKRRADEKTAVPAAERPQPISQERLDEYPAGSPERAAIEFVRALQVRNWFAAYHRLADPVLRQSVDFEGFQRAAAALYDRSLLPFTLKAVERSPGRRAVIFEVRNPKDGTYTLDTYELTRRGGRWFVVFATPISSVLLTIEDQQRADARKR